MKKRGQFHSASAAGGLIGLVTLFIVLYIIFLPPEVREELLDDETIDRDGRVTTFNNTLLKQTVGRLEFYAPSFDHFIPSVYIFEKKDSLEIKYGLSNPCFNTVFLQKSKIFCCMNKNVLGNLE